MMHPSDMLQDIERVLISKEEIAQKVEEVGAQLSKDYAGKCPIFVGVLKGVVPFYAAMLQAVTIACQTDFMWVSSYSGTESTGTLTFRKDLEHDIAGRHVVILEDILDSGTTLYELVRILKERNPASIKICTLLDKPSGRKKPIEPDYCCFTIPSAFVVGYGLDYEEYYRNLPFVGVLKPSVYEDL